MTQERGICREIAAVLDLTWVYAELAPHYPRIGRPSVDPVPNLRGHLARHFRQIVGSTSRDFVGRSG